MIIADSWIWIEYFRGTDYGSILDKYLKKSQVATPNIVLLEIAGKYIREGLPKDLVRARLLFIVTKSEIVEFDHELAVSAAECLLELRAHAKKLGLKKKPGIADGLILALARRLGMKILTGDEHFKNLPEAIYVKE